MSKEDTVYVSPAERKMVQEAKSMESIPWEEIKKEVGLDNET